MSTRDLADNGYRSARNSDDENVVRSVHAWHTGELGSPFSAAWWFSLASLTDDTAFSEDEDSEWEAMPSVPSMLVHRRESKKRADDDRDRDDESDELRVVMIDPDEISVPVFSSLASESDTDERAEPCAEPFMRALHRIGARRPTVFYVVSQTFDQLLAIVPVLLWVVLFRLVFLDHAALDDAARILGGLALIVIGLFLFMEGLNFAMMPLGEVIGKHLNGGRVHPAVTFAYVFVLGILVTLCEPAINALQTLGKMIEARRAPHLHFLVHDWVDFWFVAVAVGVGLASVLGMVRIRRRWPLKPVIVVLVVAGLWLVPAVL